MFSNATPPSMTFLEAWTVSWCPAFQFLMIQTIILHFGARKLLSGIIFKIFFNFVVTGLVWPTDCLRLGLPIDAGTATRKLERKR